MDDERMTGEKLAQSLGVDPSPTQRRVEACPTATMRWFEAQVNGRRDDTCRKGGVGELEEGVDTAIEAAVERVSESAQDGKVRGFHNDAFCSRQSPSTTPVSRQRPIQLKRKLRGCANRRVANVSMGYEEAVRSLRES